MVTNPKKASSFKGRFFPGNGHEERDKLSTMSSSRPSVAGAQTHSAHASLPVPFALDDTASTGEPGLETTQGKALLLEAKRRALTEEVYVEPAMLKV